MKKSKRKIIILLILITISLIIGMVLYINSTTEIMADKPYVVTLGENNCNITVENNTTVIQKYNGNAILLLLTKIL